MSFGYLDLHVAQQKMSLKDSNSCLSFVSTLWKGEVIMCCYSNLSNELVNIFCLQELEPGDVEELEKLVRDFINIV